MKKILLLITIFLQVNLYSQYGSTGLRCEITLRIPNKGIRLFQEQYGSPYPQNGTQKKELKSINNKYYAEGRKGDYGSGFFEPVILIKKMDTMRIFLPIHSLMKEGMYLNVPFRKGDYRIPYHTYVVHKILKPEYRKKLKPNLNGDWSDFEIHKKPYKNIYFKRLKLIYRKCNNKYDYKKIEKKLKRISYSNPFENYLLKDIDWNEHFVGYKNKKFIGYHNNNKINFIGVLKGGKIAIYQEKQNGPIEYGIFKTSNNRIKLHTSHSSFINSKQNKPTMYGLYTTKIKYKGGKSHCEMFEIVIETDKDTIKKNTEKQ